MRAINIFKLSVSVLVSLLATSRAGKCPTDAAAFPIDLNQFAGEWYMISGTTVTGRAGKCLHFFVDRISEHELRMNFTTTSYRNDRRIWWAIEGNKFGKKINATWQLNSSSRKIGPFEHRIIDIDYKSYAAMIVCAQDNQYIPKQYFAMIWSRRRIFDDDILMDLKNKISLYIAREDIVDIDTTCTELD